MMRGKTPVDPAIQDRVRAGQRDHQALQHLARRAIAVIPHDIENAIPAIPIRNQPREVIGRDIHAGFAARLSHNHVARCRACAKILDLPAEERLAGSASS